MHQCKSRHEGMSTPCCTHSAAHARETLVFVLPYLSNGAVQPQVIHAIAVQSQCSASSGASPGKGAQRLCSAKSKLFTSNMVWSQVYHGHVMQLRRTRVPFVAYNQDTLLSLLAKPAPEANPHAFSQGTPWQRAWNTAYGTGLLAFDCGGTDFTSAHTHRVSTVSTAHPSVWV